VVDERPEQVFETGAHAAGARQHGPQLLTLHLGVRLERQHEQLLLAAEGGIETAATQAQVIEERADRGGFEALLAEQFGGAPDGVLAVETGGARHTVNVPRSGTSVSERATWATVRWRTANAVHREHVRTGAERSRR